MKIINTLFIVILFSAILVGQKITIVYEAKNHTIHDSALDNIPELADQKVIYKYSLTIYNGQSIFSRDSLFIINYPLNGKEYWTYENIYKDYNDDLWITIGGKYEEGYGLKKNISTLVKNNNHNWQITEEKKKIAGVECIKAITSNNKSAWYAPSIPYPDGPQYGVFGLPGVVLEYDTGYDIWTATEIYLNEKKEIKIPDCKMIEAKNNLSYDKLKRLDSDKVIVIGNNNPWNVWLKFDNKD